MRYKYSIFVNPLIRFIIGKMAITANALILNMTQSPVADVSSFIVFFRRIHCFMTKKYQSPGVAIKASSCGPRCGRAAVDTPVKGPAPSTRTVFTISILCLFVSVKHLHRVTVCTLYMLLWADKSELWPASSSAICSTAWKVLSG